jgi:hypothetical protein
MGIDTRASRLQTARIAAFPSPRLAAAVGYGRFASRENHNATGISAAP